MFNDQRMYRPDEVAERWNVDRRTVYRLVENGLLKAAKIGGCIRISGAELNRYEDDNAVDAMGLKEVEKRYG